MAKRDSREKHARTRLGLAIEALEPRTLLTVEFASWADQFVDSIGFNVHSSYPDTPYHDWTRTATILNDIGVRHLRGVEGSKIQSFNAVVGVRTRLGAGWRLDPSPAAVSAALDAIKSQYPRGQIDAVEGPNEYDLAGDYNHGDDPDWAATLRAFDAEVHRQMRSDPWFDGIPYIGPSLANSWNDQALGDQSAVLDGANIHDYTGGTNPDSTPSQAGLKYAGYISGSNPLWSTESGYFNGSASKSVSEAISGRYLLRQFLEHFNAGYLHSYSYELIDEWNQPTNSEANYGIVRNDYSYKPAAIALKNMIATLRDPQPTPFNPTSLDYTITTDNPGSLAGIHHTLLQKADGRFEIVLWREMISTDAESSPITVNLSFASSIENAVAYKPEQGTSKSLTISSNKLQVAVTDAVTIVEVTPSARPSLPESPGNLLVKPASATFATLIWQDHASNEDGFRIERQTGTFDWVPIATVGANTTTYTDTDLDPATVYHYRLRALNRAGFSAATPVAIFITSPAPEIVDPLASFTRTTSGTRTPSGWKIDIPKDPYWRDLDPSVASNISGSANSLVYQYTNISNFKATVYLNQYQASSSVKAYASHDGRTWTTLPTRQSRTATTPGYQSDVIFLQPATPLPAGTNYLKVEIGPNASLGTMQLAYEGLAANWRFDESTGSTASDASGQGNSLSLYFGAHFSPGKVGNALQFPGTGSFATVSSPDLNAANGITLGGWVRMTFLNGDMCIASNQDLFSSGYKLAISGGKVLFEIRDDVGNTYGTRSIPGGTVLQPNTWYYLAAIYDPTSGSIKTYVNGMLDRSAAVPGAIGPSSHPLEIGRDPSTISDHFVGSIDDLRVYNRPLSDFELATLVGPFTPVSQRLQAEDFDAGGQGISYFDYDQANTGGQYRPNEWVDIETTNDADGGYDVTSTKPIEWLNYSIVVPATALYDLSLRIASASGGGVFHVEDTDGINLTGPLTVPPTGTGPTGKGWTTLFKRDINLAAGRHVLKIVFDSGGAGPSVCDINWLDIRPASPAPISTPWSDSDIGAPAVKGAASYDAATSTYIIKGAGSDIWYGSDQFHFACQDLSGNATAIARVVTQAYTDGWAKSGLMFRSSTAANAPFVMLAVTPGNGITLQSRSTTGGNAASIASNTAITAPLWLKLVRAGNTFAASYSNDGSTWTLLGTTSVTMPATAKAGLAVTSHNASTLNSASFTDVFLGSAKPTTPTHFSVSIASASQINLTWDDTTNETGFIIERSVNGAPFTPLATVPANTTAYNDTNLGTGSKFYYRVRSVNPIDESANSFPLAAIRLLGTSGNDTYTLRFDPANSWVELYDNIPATGAPSYVIDRSSLVGVLVNGQAGDDRLTIDFSNGNPVPSAGIVYDGGDQPSIGDTLTLIGTPGGDTVNATDTQITLGDSAPVRFYHVEHFHFDLGDGLDTLNFNGDWFDIDHDLSEGASHLTFNANGLVRFRGIQHLARLNLAPNVTAALIDDGLLDLGGLTLAVGARLDLTNGSLIVRNGFLPEVESLVRSARNGAATLWTGPGIGSSTAADNSRTTLAVISNNRGNGTPIFSTFAGQPVSADDVLIKYTWNGDVNLDGVVDAADYFLVDSGFITQKGGYRNGDLNYDGVVDAGDYFLIDSAFIAQTGVMASEEAPTRADGPAVPKPVPASNSHQTPSVLQQLFSVKPVL